MRPHALSSARQHENPRQVAGAADTDCDKQKQPVVLLSDTGNQLEHQDLRLTSFHDRLTPELEKSVKS
jgi:type VI protein secretion system component Hcp